MNLTFHWLQGKVIGEVVPIPVELTFALLAHRFLHLKTLAMFDSSEKEELRMGHMMNRMFISVRSDA